MRTGAGRRWRPPRRSWGLIRRPGVEHAAGRGLRVDHGRAGAGQLGDGRPGRGYDHRPVRRDGDLGRVRGRAAGRGIGIGRRRIGLRVRRRADLRAGNGVGSSSGSTSGTGGSGSASGSSSIHLVSTGSYEVQASVDASEVGLIKPGPGVHHRRQRDPEHLRHHDVRGGLVPRRDRGDRHREPADRLQATVRCAPGAEPGDQPDQRNDDRARAERRQAGTPDDHDRAELRRADPGAARAPEGERVLVAVPTGTGAGGTNGRTGRQSRAPPSSSPTSTKPSRPAPPPPASAPAPAPSPAPAAEAPGRVSRPAVDVAGAARQWRHTSYDRFTTCSGETRARWSKSASLCNSTRSSRMHTVAIRQSVVRRIVSPWRRAAR